MSQLIAFLLSLPPVLVLVAAFLFPALEASALVGLVVPGETAVFVAGVSAHGGRVPLAAVMLVATVGAVAGDQVGFMLGRRWGPGLFDRMPRRLRGGDRFESAARLVRDRGAWVVVLGRWTALLRALVPGLAGSTGMHPRTFTVYNVVGAVTWAVVVAALGFGAGAAYQRVLSQMTHGSEIALAAVLVTVAAVLVARRVSRRDTGGAA